MVPLRDEDNGWQMPSVPGGRFQPEVSQAVRSWKKFGETEAQI